VSAVAYSTQKAPYGFPASRDKWQFSFISTTQLDTGTLTSTSTGQITGHVLNIPSAGYYRLFIQVYSQQNPVSGNSSAYVFALSTSTTSISDIELGSPGGISLAASAVQATAMPVYREKTVFVTAATPYYLVAKNNLGVSSVCYVNTNAGACTMMVAENAYL
jgi:hypothetical protein